MKIITPWKTSEQETLLKLVGIKAKNFTEGMKEDTKETPQHTKGKEKQWNTELSARKETKLSIWFNATDTKTQQQKGPEFKPDSISTEIKSKKISTS